MDLPYQVTGLDSSLTAFGLAAASTEPGLLPHLYRLQPKTRGHERLEYLRTKVRDLCNGADLVALEGLSFGAKGNALLDLAGLHWMIRHEVWALGIPYVIISPPQVKLYATGNALADKIAVVMALARKFPTLEIASSDEADSLALACMAAHWLGQPLFEPTKAQTEVLHAKHTTKGKRGQPKIVWPDMNRPAQVQETLA